jgi:hypothetical protein
MVDEISILVNQNALNYFDKPVSSASDLPAEYTPYYPNT